MRVHSNDSQVELPDESSGTRTSHDLRILVLVLLYVQQQRNLVAALKPVKVVKWSLNPGHYFFITVEEADARSTLFHFLYYIIWIVCLILTVVHINQTSDFEKGTSTK